MTKVPSAPASAEPSRGCAGQADGTFVMRTARAGVSAGPG